MFCSNCGREYKDGEKFCSNCGTNFQCNCQTKQVQTSENSVWGILAIVFGALGGGSLGLIFSIVGLCVYKTPSNRRNAWIGLGLTIAWTIIELTLIVVLLAVNMDAIINFIQQSMPVA